MITKFRIICSKISQNNLPRTSLLFKQILANNKLTKLNNQVENFQYTQHSLFTSSAKSYNINNIVVNTTEDTAKIDFINGLVKVTLKLPARGELCEFNLKLLNDTVGTLIENILFEDKSVEKAQIFTQDGTRISQNTPISAIVLQPFQIKINDSLYNLEPPSIFAKETTANQNLAVNTSNDLEEIKKLVSKLYLHLNVEQFENKREEEMLRQLEILTSEIQPMEKSRQELSLIAKKHTNRMVWLGLGLMGIQAGIMARLTWFDYSWDIVEPISYFVSYSAVVGTYAYFVLTRKEYDYASATDRIFLRNFHKNAPKMNLDVSKYNELKNTIYKLENDLRQIKTSQLKNYERE